MDRPKFLLYLAIAPDYDNETKELIKLRLTYHGGFHNPRMTKTKKYFPYPEKCKNISDKIGLKNFERVGEDRQRFKIEAQAAAMVSPCWYVC